MLKSGTQSEEQAASLEETAATMEELSTTVRENAAHARRANDLARAGDQGRGFAVVASEVRSLSQRCAEAATEIKELIGTSVSQVDDGSTSPVPSPLRPAGPCARRADARATAAGSAR